MKRLGELIAAASGRGELGTVDGEQLSRVLFSIYFQQLQSWLSGYLTRERFEANLAAMVRFVIDPHLARG